MRKQLFKKLSAFIVMAMLFSANAVAQIVYKDVNPDLTSTGTYNLDLNGDGITDFIIVHNTLNGPCSTIGHFIRVTPTGNNQVVDYTTASATKMAVNTVINSSTLTWSSTANQLMAMYRNLEMRCTGHHFVGAGQWYNAVDGYLGLKLIKNGNTYYGWARITITSQVHSFVIKDFAYDKTPNHSIRAGATSGAKRELSDAQENFSGSDQFQLAPNPFSNSTTISFTLAQAGKVSLNIFDLNGRLIKILAENIFAEGEHSIVWNAEEVNAGIYFLQVRSDEFSNTRKLIVTQ